MNSNAVNLNEHLILFADLIGSTEVASEAQPIEFARYYIRSYKFASSVARDFVSKEKKPFKKFVFQRSIASKDNIFREAGDEVLSFARLRTKDDNDRLVAQLVGSAVAFAFNLKLCWFAAPYNLRRMKGKQFPRDVAVGIHVGPAVSVSGNGKKDDVVGLHINVAKRLESAARSGSNSRIFASDDIAFLFDCWRMQHKEADIKRKPPLLMMKFNRVEASLDLKGIPVKVSAHELTLDHKNLEVLDNLYQISIGSPTYANSDLEKALRFLGQDFFRLLKKNQFPDVRGEAKYIKQWFAAVKDLRRLFYNDIWTVLTVLNLSGAFVRHPCLSPRLRNSYSKVTEEWYDRLRELIKLEKKGERPTPQIV